MRDRDGDVLYVGKAGNLRRRVRSYFGPGGRHGRLIGRALERLEVIDHETCGSEFAALLRENRLIKDLQPPCNRRGTGGAGRYLRLAGASPARLHLATAVRDDGAAYFGPLRSQRMARESVACLEVLYPLRDADPRLCEMSVRDLTAVLDGDPVALGALGLPPGRRRVGAVPLDRGEAPDGPRAVLALLAALARARRAAVRCGVIVEPSGPDGAAEVFFVAGGVVRHRAVVDAGGWTVPVRRASRRSAVTRARRPCPPTRSTRRRWSRSACATAPTP